MKIKLDIDDELLARADAAIARDGTTTLDALVEEGLTRLIAQASPESVAKSISDAKPD